MERGLCGLLHSCRSGRIAKKKKITGSGFFVQPGFRNVWRKLALKFKSGRRTVIDALCQGSSGWKGHSSA